MIDTARKTMGPEAIMRRLCILGGAKSMAPIRVRLKITFRDRLASEG